MFCTWWPQQALGITLPMVLRMQNIPRADWAQITADVSTLHHAYKNSAA